MENYMVYTPEAHIAITEVYAENGVVYLKFKKPKTQIYEVMTLDMFLSMVYQTLERKYYDESYWWVENPSDVLTAKQQIEW